MHQGENPVLVSDPAPSSPSYKYDWKLEEAQKNIMRTHTTAVSARMLYKLAQEGFKPAKYFSIDRVFRNETLDATHLAEFHQIEGVVADRNLHLGHLIGMLYEFFSRLGECGCMCATAVTMATALPVCALCVGGSLHVAEVRRASL